MKRRTVLGAACTSVAGLAGCTGFRSGAATGSPTSSTPIAEYGCPPYDPTLDGYVCSHTVDTESACVYLLPTKATTDASAETVDLTLYNESSTGLEFNSYQWEIMVQQSAGWEAIETRISGDGRVTIPPGDTHTWTFSEVVDSINEQVTVDAGTYTAAIGVPNPEESDWIQCLALIRLV